MKYFIKFALFCAWAVIYSSCSTTREVARIDLASAALSPVEVALDTALPCEVWVEVDVVYGAKPETTLQVRIEGGGMEPFSLKRDLFKPAVKLLAIEHVTAEGKRNSFSGYFEKLQPGRFCKNVKVTASLDIYGSIDRMNRLDLVLRQ